MTRKELKIKLENLTQTTLMQLLEDMDKLENENAALKQQLRTAHINEQNALGKWEQAMIRLWDNVYSNQNPT